MIKTYLKQTVNFNEINDTYIAILVAVNKVWSDYFLELHSHSTIVDSDSVNDQWLKFSVRGFTQKERLDAMHYTNDELGPSFYCSLPEGEDTLKIEWLPPTP